MASARYGLHMDLSQGARQPAHHHIVRGVRIVIRILWKITPFALAVTAGLILAGHNAPGHARPVETVSHCQTATR